MPILDVERCVAGQLAQSEYENEWSIEDPMKCNPKPGDPFRYRRTLRVAFIWNEYGLTMCWLKKVTTYEMSGQVQVRYTNLPTKLLYSWGFVSSSPKSLGFQLTLVFEKEKYCLWLEFLIVCVERFVCVHEAMYWVYHVLDHKDLGGLRCIFVDLCIGHQLF